MENETIAYACICEEFSFTLDELVLIISSVLLHFHFFFVIFIFDLVQCKIFFTACGINENYTSIKIKKKIILKFAKSWFLFIVVLNIFR